MIYAGFHCRIRYGTIAKADVIFTPPLANTTTTADEAAPADAEVNEESAYVGEEPDEVVFEEVE